MNQSSVRPASEDIWAVVMMHRPVAEVMMAQGHKCGQQPMVHALYPAAAVQQRQLQ